MFGVRSCVFYVLHPMSCVVSIALYAGCFTSGVLRAALCALCNAFGVLRGMLYVKSVTQNVLRIMFGLVRKKQYALRGTRWVLCSTPNLAATVYF